MDDDQLIARVARGDDTALQELFRRHAPWLAVRLRAVLPAADVEDVLQETFLGVWRGAKGYRPDAGGGLAVGDRQAPGGIAHPPARARVRRVARRRRRSRRREAIPLR